MTASRKMENKVIEDIMRVAEGAFGALTGFRQELQNSCKKQGNRLKQTLDLPTNDEIEVIKAMQAKILEQQETILKRLDALEHKKSKK